MIKRLVYRIELDARFFERGRTLRSIGGHTTSGGAQPAAKGLDFPAPFALPSPCW